MDQAGFAHHQKQLVAAKVEARLRRDFIEIALRSGVKLHAVCCLRLQVVHGASNGLTLAGIADEKKAQLITR